MDVRILVGALLLTACSGPPSGDAVDAETEESSTVVPEVAMASGELLFQTNCASCHTVQAPPTLAPPMSHVARHYRDTLPDREAFISRIVTWVADPAAEESLMPERAVDRFGLMPAQIVDPSELREIAAYIYTLEPEPGSMQMEGMGSEGMGSGMPMGQGGMHPGMPMGGGGMNHVMPSDSAR